MYEIILKILDAQLPKEVEKPLMESIAQEITTTLKNRIKGELEDLRDDLSLALLEHRTHFGYDE